MKSVAGGGGSGAGGGAAKSAGGHGTHSNLKNYHLNNFLVLTTMG